MDYLINNTFLVQDIAIDASSGVIYATGRESPYHAFRDRFVRTPRSDEPPELRSSSDITWDMWNTGVPASSLADIRWYFSVNVQNTESRSIISRALRSTNQLLSPWPGTKFGMDSEAGKAILGTYIVGLFEKYCGAE